MNKLNVLSRGCVLEPLSRQLLGTLKPSMVALRLLPAGEGTSNRLGSDSSINSTASESFFRKTPFVDFVDLEVLL